MTFPSGLSRVADPDLSPYPSRFTPRGVLEIELGGAGRRRLHTIAGSRLVIGRGPDADLLLDDASVAPAHAELVCSPFGHWWVHDLGTPGGTRVRGQPVNEHMLAPGDDIAVGAFTLRMRGRGADELRLVRARGAPLVRGGPPAEDAECSGTCRRISSEVPDGELHADQVLRVMSMGRELLHAPDGQRRRELLLRLLVGDSFPGESVVILRVTGPDTAEVVLGPLHRDGHTAPLALSARVVSRLWETRRPTRSEAPHWTDGPHRSAEQRTVVACPLDTHHGGLAAVYVELPGRCGGRDWCALVTLIAETYVQAEQVADMRAHVREASSIERELQAARQIQRRLVPQHETLDALLQELDVAVGFEPCRWVGGDYVDAQRMPDGRILLAIADVCGKGLQAALVASSLHTLVRGTVDLDRPVPELVQRINRYLCQYLPEDVFVTLACAAVHVHSGEIEFLSAGHPAALVASPDGRAALLARGNNVALGLMDFPALESIREGFGPDDVLLLYTDGLSEAVNERRELLGVDRLAVWFSRIVSEYSGCGVGRMRQELLDALRSYRGSRLATDDSTFLIARRRASLRPG